MKILSPNKNGQIVIPIEIRRQLGINESSLLMAEVQNGGIVYMPVKQINARELKKTVLSPKNKPKKYTFADAKKFMFSGPKNLTRNLSRDIDKILYS